MRRQGLIYLATCRQTGRKYVGQTIQTLKKRQKSHISIANNPKDKRNQPFTRALHK